MVSIYSPAENVEAANTTTSFEASFIANIETKELNSQSNVRTTLVGGRCVREMRQAQHSQRVTSPRRLSIILPMKISNLLRRLVGYNCRSNSTFRQRDRTRSESSTKVVCPGSETCVAVWGWERKGGRCRTFQPQLLHHEHVAWCLRTVSTSLFVFRNGLIPMV